MKSFFKPNNIAIVGASPHTEKAGHIILKNMLGSGYAGTIYPIHKSAGKILGLKAYKSLTEIQGTVELVVLITPSHAIEGIMQDMDIRMQQVGDIKAIVVAAAGYSETKSKDGIKREKILIDMASKYNIRVIGPNCIGVIDFVNKLNTTFVETHLPYDYVVKPSGISFISQSGAIAASLLMMGASRPEPLGFNKFVSIGNMADVDFIDLLQYLADDDDTKVIGIYMEGYPKTRQLIDVMKSISQKKPIVVLKVGTSDLGAVAANSHTGSMAGEDVLYDSAFRQFGITRVSDIQELLDTLYAFDSLPKINGWHSYILTQAGGPGIFTVDQVSLWKKICLTDLGDDYNNKLKSMLPEMANVGSPKGYSDITASASIEHHNQSLDLIIRHPEINALQFITIVPTFLDVDNMAKQMIDIIKSQNKPIFISIMAGEYVMHARSILEKAGIPTFNTPKEAVRAMGHMMTYYDYLRREV